MSETITLTIKVSHKNDYNCTNIVESTIEQAPYETTDAFIARARAMYEQLKESARD